MTHDDRPAQPVQPQPSAQRDPAYFVKLRAPSGRAVYIRKSEAEFIRMLVERGYAKVTP